MHILACTLYGLMHIVDGRVKVGSNVLLATETTRERGRETLSQTEREGESGRQRPRETEREGDRDRERERES